MNTLKEILVDAARYRWLRENLDLTNESMGDGIPPDLLDRYVDENLCRESKYE